MSKYHVGDRVVVRDDLNTHTSYNMEWRGAIPDGAYLGGLVAVTQMLELAGRTVEIAEINDENHWATGTYKICFDSLEPDGDFAWTDEMFSGLAEDQYAEYELPHLSDLLEGME